MVELKHKFEKAFFEEEPRELRVSRDKKEIWAVELDLLQEFMRVCEKHHLKWFIDGGSLLGAARHGGIIPWDDDIDVCMFREDYEKLAEISEHEFAPPYFFQTYKSDRGYSRGHAQFRNSETTAILKNEMSGGKPINGFNQGVFIDVFPMDNIPDDEVEAASFLRGVEDAIQMVYRVSFLQHWWRNVRWKHFLFIGNYKLIFRCLKMKYLARKIKGDYLAYVADRHNKYVRQHNGARTSRCCTIANWPLRKPSQYYRREWFDETVMLDFEMLKVPAPAGYDALLTGLYGNWHKHVVGGLLHGGILFDLDKSYREYLN